MNRIANPFERMLAAAKRTNFSKIFRYTQFVFSKDIPEVTPLILNVMAVAVLGCVVAFKKLKYDPLVRIDKHKEIIEDVPFTPNEIERDLFNRTAPL